MACSSSNEPHSPDTCQVPNAIRDTSRPDLPNVVYSMRLAYPLSRQRNDHPVGSADRLNDRHSPVENLLVGIGGHGERGLSQTEQRWRGRPVLAGLLRLTVL